MGIRVWITKDYEAMSEFAAKLLQEEMAAVLGKKSECVLGLATGASPVGMYQRLAKQLNSGAFNCSKIRSFNLDEYVGLPGENAQQRALHPESYSYFMIKELFSLLDRPFAETSVPWGTLIDQDTLASELQAHPEDYRQLGSDAGKSVAFADAPKSEYLAWIRKEILLAYEAKIKAAGGIDIQVIGSGGKGHVAFHEAGIPFEKSRVLLVKLDDNTVKNAVVDGHFAKEEDSPQYAISMGAELVYEAKTVLLLASGARKAQAIADSLLLEPTADVPISYSQQYGKAGGNMLYVVDAVAGAPILSRRSDLEARGIELRVL